MMLLASFMNSIKLTALNFSENYQFRLKQNEGINYIFCIIRKKWFLLTPEEWVRQHIVHFLIHEKKYTNTSINTEVVVEIVGMKKRDRKSTRLNSSHVAISYAVFCLKK